MSQSIAEADWKVFKQLHAVALERCYDRAMHDLKRLIAGDGGDSRDRFHDALKLLEERRRELADLIDDFRRSTAVMQLAMICSRELLTDEEISRFSPEVRATVQKFLELRTGSAKRE